MFCPSCGAKNPTGARACGDCKRALPAAPATRSSLPDAAATVPDSPAQPPPQPPRILKRAAPLAPPPAALDTLPKRQGSSVGPDDPTLVRPRVQSPSPITLPQVDPFTSDSDTRPMSGLSPTEPTMSDAPPPAPRPVTLAVPPPAAPPVSPAAAPAHASPPAASSATRTAPPRAAPARSAAAAAAAVPRAPARAAEAPRDLEPLGLPAEETAAETPAEGQPAASVAVLADAASTTPVTLEVPSALRTVCAALVDTIVGVAIVGAIQVALLQAKGVRVGWQPVVDMLHADPVGGAVALVALPLAAIALYLTLSVLVLAGTLGHRALGLRVWTTTTGRRPGLVRSCVRGVAAALGVALFAAGPLWGLLLDRRRRGLGDLVARSVVARAREAR